MSESATGMLLTRSLSLSCLLIKVFGRFRGRRMSVFFHHYCSLPSSVGQQGCSEKCFTLGSNHLCSACQGAVRVERICFFFKVVQANIRNHELGLPRGPPQRGEQLLHCVRAHLARHHLCSSSGSWSSWWPVRRSGGTSRRTLTATSCSTGVTTSATTTTSTSPTPNSVFF